MDFRLAVHDLYARTERLRYLGRERLDNLYLATVQKCGSQWMSAIFNDIRMKRITGLVRMPQRFYEYGQHVSRFPKGFFVPGLYVSYQAFESFIEKPKNYRVIYVYRDPRDLVVSDYYSTLKTHANNAVVKTMRTRLEGMSKEDGLAYIMRYNDKFSYMRSWIELSGNDKNVMHVKFEEITSRPVEVFGRIMEHCGITVETHVLASILSEYEKDKMRQRDLARRNDKTESHYRFEASSHEREFSEMHYKLFRDITGDLLEVLGYA